ncbi:MAG: CBS domain-containing protein, partial [Myxococcota bacterium]
DGQLVGLVSRLDLLDQEGVEAVNERMRRDPLAIHPEAPVSVAAAIMRSEDRSAMPVADAGRIVGVLTRTDVLAAVASLPSAA